MIISRDDDRNSSLLFLARQLQVFGVWVLVIEHACHASFSKFPCKFRFDLHLTKCLQRNLALPHFRTPRRRPITRGYKISPILKFTALAITFNASSTCRQCSGQMLHFQRMPDSQRIPRTPEFQRIPTHARISAHASARPNFSAFQRTP